MGEFIVEIIFKGFILGIFKVIRTIGIVIIKIFTFNKDSFSEISEAYDDSVIPYLTGFSLTIAVVYLLLKFT